MHFYLLYPYHYRQEKGINTVLNVEMDDFQRLRTRLLVFLEKRLTGFRIHFPFNRPEGGLEKLLALLDRVRTTFRLTVLLKVFIRKRYLIKEIQYD